MTASERIAFEFIRTVGEFPSAVELSDKNSSEIFLDERQKKDVKFKLSGVQLERGIQSVATTTDFGLQTATFAKKNAATQFTSRFPTQEMEEALDTAAGAQFMSLAVARVTEAMELVSWSNVYEKGLLRPEEMGGAVFLPQNSILADVDTISDLDHARGRVITDSILSGTTLIFAAASTPEFSQRAQECGKPELTYVLVWDLLNPIRPVHVLGALSRVQCLATHPTENMLFGGCENGQVVMWNLEMSAERHSWMRVMLPTAISLTEISHTEAVESLSFLPSGFAVNHNGDFAVHSSGTESEPTLVSISTEGTISFWTAEDAMTGRHQWRPVCSYAMWKPPPAQPTRKRVPTNLRQMVLIQSLMTLPFPSEEGLPVFVFGTERGNIAFAEMERAQCRDLGKEDRHDSSGMSSAAGRPLPPPIVVDFLSDAHAEPILRLLPLPHAVEIPNPEKDRNKNVIFLSVSAHFAYVWYMEQQLLQIKPQSGLFTDAAWSPDRPSVLVLTTTEGKAELYSLLERYSEPALVQDVTPACLTCVRFGDDGLLGFADTEGRFHLRRMPDVLRHPDHAEAAGLLSLLMKELSYIVDVESRSDEDFTPNPEQTEQLSISGDFKVWWDRQIDFIDTGYAQLLAVVNQKLAES